MATTAERHLLFGLIALQVGLIDQGQLVAAFQAWARDKLRPLADHLAARGDLDAEARASVEALVALQLKKHGNNAEVCLASLPADRSTRDSLTRLTDVEIEASLAHLGAATAAVDQDGERTATYSVGNSTSHGQRFRVLRPHATGGLGAVFIALDTELNREVAFKQILEQHADDPESRQRFLVEAEITGGLEHPGVVPVYGLGADSRGRPYYAMRFIRGDSLKEAIAQFHCEPARVSAGSSGEPGRVSAGSGLPRTPRGALATSLAFRRLLRRFVDVCNAVDYAHSRGVIHRDLKPSNIIVGKHGETLVVDWGLAKVVGRATSAVGEQTIAPSASGSSETLPGSALGTPAYMSPEQARGELDRLSPRSDVYSLGATLYGLLTGKPPFENEDVGAVLRAVQDGRFQRPSQHVPALDKGLEGICLKAMSTNAQDRYPTAKALADDLERWMADEPVTACAEPLTSRARRWGRRNRTVVTAMAAAVLVALVGTAAVLAVQTRANGRLQQANSELLFANRRAALANTALTAANEREKQRFGLAMDAIKLFHGEVSEDLLLKEKQFGALRTKLLKGAADFYGRLEEHLKGQTDRESRAALGRAYHELGMLIEKIGDQPAALTVQRKALDVHRELASEPGADANTKLALAVSLSAVGWLQRSTGDIAAARAACEEALHLAEEAERRGGAAERSADALAGSYQRIGILLGETGDTAGALAAFHKALGIWQRLADANPGVTRYQEELALGYFGLVVHLSRKGDLAGARMNCSKAQALQQKLADLHPGDMQVKQQLAAISNGFGPILFEMGDTVGAVSAYRKAMRIFEELAEANPSVAQFQRDLAWTQNSLGFTLGQAGELTAARAAYEKGLAIRQKLADASPSIIDLQFELATTHSNIGFLLSRIGDLAGATSAYTKTLTILCKLADANPKVIHFQYALAQGLANLGWVLVRSGKPADSIPYFSREEVIWKTLAESNPSIPDYKTGLGNCQTNTATVLLRLGRSAEARALCERAVEVRDVVVSAHARIPRYRKELAESLLRRGQARRAEGDDPGAAADWSRAVDLFKAVPAMDGEYVFYYAATAACLSALAGRPGTEKSDTTRETEAENALALLRRAIDLGYRDPVTFRTETALDPLRGRADFRLLTMDLDFPAEPFATAR
jgi:serine/threonine-protein kinase